MEWKDRVGFVCGDSARSGVSLGWACGGDHRGGADGEEGPGRTCLGRSDRTGQGVQREGTGGHWTEGCTPGLGGPSLTGRSHPVLLPGSASVRLPDKLGEKLERYRTAIQVGGAGRGGGPRG